MSALDKQHGGCHYKDMAIQPIVFILKNDIPYREANVIKYTCRHAHKNGAEDIRKAIHYLEMILEDYEGAEAADDDGWIPNPNCGVRDECPIDPETECRIRCIGWESKNAKPAGYWTWDDITHYKLA